MSTAILSLYADECCENKCESTPINCCCYTPSFHPLCNGCGYMVSVDFLYWYGKETGLCYAQRNTTIQMTPVTSGATVFAPFLVVPREYKWMNESWDPGVRVRLGWTDFCNDWDLLGSWTYFATSKKQSTHVDDFILGNHSYPLGNSLQSPWIYAKICPSTADPIEFNEISAKWSLSTNVFDLTIGRNNLLAPCFSFRPYLGLRGGWTKTKFKTDPTLDATTSSSVTINGTNKVSFKNEFWGVGLLGGFEPRWHFGCGFSLFGNVDSALLWGWFETNRKETIDIALDIPSTLSFHVIEPLGNSKSKFSQLQAILDLGIGIGWESSFCCDCFLLGLDLGWEYHLWFDHNHRIQLRGHAVEQDVSQNQFGVSFVDFDETYGNLIMSGLVVRARLEF